MNTASFFDDSKLSDAIDEHKKVSKEFIEYGTAGFRTLAENLDHVLFRMGLLAVLRSAKKKGYIGVMITASHNPECDNGVKLVDPEGEMLEVSWELLATKLANVEDAEVPELLKEIALKEGISAEDVKLAGVVTGRDTRPSGDKLLKAVHDGVLALGAEFRDFEVLSTPALHYIVAGINRGENTSMKEYLENLVNAFNGIYQIQGNCGTSRKEEEPSKYVANLVLDGANGVGGFVVFLLEELIKKDVLSIEHWNICITSSPTNEQLNHLCGADYVKVEQKPPANLKVKANTKCASLDGDADRLVYFYVDEESKFHLLDGDRIATLIAAYLQELVREAGLGDRLRLGLVQTAYANSASTRYISDCLRVPVACVPTGVKFLHAKALEFDIGVYFEANGHGTVLFSSNAKDTLEAAQKNSELAKAELPAISKLVNCMKLANQTVGDALSDMLLVESILRERNWDLSDWERCYQDLPNKQIKVKVDDRNAITTTDAERCCLTPPGLQARIDELVAGFSQGRAFVRPSGTENIVRVYAEAETPSDAQNLAAQVAQVVKELLSSS